MSEAQRDEVIPRGAWQFDQEVTAVFDDMLQRSIPQYNAMRMVTFEVGRRFVQPGTAIIDMGCSRGQALLSFVSNFGAANDYFGMEISEPMIEAARQNFSYHPHGERVSIQSAVLRHEFPRVTSSLVFGDLFDDGKPNKSFMVGVFCFALAILTVPFLVSCATPSLIQGEFISKDGIIKVHPDGRFEVVVEPRTGK